MANTLNPAEAAAHLLNDAANVKAMVVGYVDDKDEVTYFTSGGVLPCVGLTKILAAVLARKIESVIDEGEGLDELDEDEP